jgi:hypothetical protein
LYVGAVEPATGAANWGKALREVAGKGRHFLTGLDGFCPYRSRSASAAQLPFAILFAMYSLGDRKNLAPLLGKRVFQDRPWELGRRLKDYWTTWPNQAMPAQANECLEPY